MSDSIDKLCEFEVVTLPDGQRRFVCQGGVEHITRSPRYYRTCDCSLAEKKPIRKAICIHLGAETSRQACNSCGGEQWEIKLFACPLHGQCTIGFRLEGIQCCASCTDYESKPESGR